MKHFVLVKAGYTNGRKYVYNCELDSNDLPLDVAPSMVCDKLERIPESGEQLYLGKSIKHHYPSDVIVKLASDYQVELLNWIEKADIEDVARFIGEKDLSPQYLFDIKNDIIDDACNKAWDMSAQDIGLFFDNEKKRLAKKLLNMMTPEEIESYGESDYIWGEGKEEFFEEAYRLLDKGEVVDVPAKFEKAGEAYRYGAFKDFYLD